MTRTGKIARLPRALREELNHRLQNGIPGRSLVAWLNERPEVREMLASQFEGRPINEQNLTEWKQGGFTEWQTRQELVERVRDVAGDAADLAEAGGPLADHAARMLSARFALALSEWDGEPDHPAAAKLNALSRHSRELIALRRGDHSAARLRMEQVRFDKEQAAEVELDKMELRNTLGIEFQKWLQRPDIKHLMESGRTTDGERIAAIQRLMWGTLAGLATPSERKQTLTNFSINGDGI